MKTEQSELLTQFYQAYLAWVEAGASTDHHCFKRRYGLCGNFIEWADDGATIYEMTDQFGAKGLNWRYPFNRSGEQYKLETQCHAHHLNERRMQWVRDHAIEVS